MSKIGINISIDVTKIDKSRLFQGKKGTYMNLTTFIDTSELDQYDNNGFISQATSKEEREANVRTTILGNCKVFFNDDGSSNQVKQEANGEAFDDPIPF